MIGGVGVMLDGGPMESAVQVLNTLTYREVRSGPARDDATARLVLDELQRS